MGCGSARLSDGCTMPSLDQIDHIRLALLPTPLEPLPRLSRMLGGPEIWVKRDDCTGLGLGGNKARPLEYLVAEAIAEQADVLITTGGLQSNHARQTAAAAARCGLQCILVLINAVSGRDDAYGTSGNMLLDRLFGARIQIEPAGTDAASAMAAAAQQCRAEGRRPYVIPSGGSNATGVIGHVRAAHELLAQCDAQKVACTQIVVASGSGGTHAGLALGLGLCGFSAPVIGYCVSRTATEQRGKVAGLLEQTCTKLDVASPRRAADLVFEEGVLGAGYGQPTSAMREAVGLVAALEGIVLDPVYTGKAMAGLIAAIQTGRVEKGDTVVFMHTGGSSSLFGYPDVFVGQLG
jgi:D-cysteine desulfhydrase family pyridoxal phosphate-dependent enzyme